MAAVSTMIGIAKGIAAAGTVIGGIQDQQRADFEANVALQQAEQEGVASAEAERDFRRNQSAAMAEYRAAAGSSGVQVGSGSPLLTFADFGAETELQARRIRKGGEIRATRLRQQAELSKMGGRASLLKGVTRGGSTLLTGFARSKEARRVPPTSSDPRIGLF